MLVLREIVFVVLPRPLFERRGLRSRRLSASLLQEELEACDRVGRRSSARLALAGLDRQV